ncbi:DUF3304 domain-containing protein [Glaciimonas sp. GG7]
MNLPMNRRKTLRLQCLLFFPVTLALSACTTPKPSEPLEVIPYVNVPMTAVPISCSYHPGTDYIYSFGVEEFFSKAMKGGLSCGGTGAFGYRLPDKWQPGMKVKVRWKPNARDWIEKTTTIRRYEKPETLFVHFFTNDEVRVVSSGPYPGSPNHPILESVVIAPPEEE